MRHTSDRGDIVHFAGLHGLSPALDGQGAPALSSQPGDGLARCGWAAFFEAVERRGLALAHDPADPGAARFLPPSRAGGAAPPHGFLSGAVAHSRRFWAALFPAAGAGSGGDPPSAGG